MIQLLRTTSNHVDFIELVKNLDAELALRDGDQHTFYAQYNKIDAIKDVVVAFENHLPVACGAIKEYDLETMEIKRMFTHVNSRGKGTATLVLKELEKWSTELQYQKCILETGINQKEALAFYAKNKYNLTPNYGQYAQVKDSKCFEKLLT